MRRVLLALALSVLARPAEAHESLPGLLVVRANGGAWSVVWRPPSPALDEMQPELPAACAAVTQRPGRRWRLRCDAEALVFRWPGRASSTEILVRFEPAGADPQVVRVGDAAVWRAAAPVAATPSWPMYLPLGIEHILLGFDHLAFVFGLLFLVSGGRRLLFVLTAFTVAHSLTLAAAVLGWASVPSAPVEATIALSVAFVARSALVAPSAGASGRAGAFAFGFGLLHGLGFAGALADLGLPAAHVPEALLAFNVGVELGQLAVVGAALGLVHVLRRLGARGLHGLRTPALYGLGTLAALWTIERLGGLV